MGADTSGYVYFGGQFSNVSGANTAPAGITRLAFVRSTNSGLLDLTFNPNPDSTLKAINIQATGANAAIYFGGHFLTLSGVTRTHIARLTMTGAFDPSFNASVSGDSQVTINAISVQPDGNVLIGGNFTGVGGVIRNMLARVTSTGLLDTTFDPNLSGTSATVNTIVIQPDGMIIVGGTFSTIG